MLNKYTSFTFPTRVKIGVDGSREECSRNRSYVSAEKTFSQFSSVSFQKPSDEWNDFSTQTVQTGFVHNACITLRCCSFAVLSSENINARPLLRVYELKTGFFARIFYGTDMKSERVRKKCTCFKSVPSLASSSRNARVYAQSYFHVRSSSCAAASGQGSRERGRRGAQQTSSNKSRVYCANAAEFMVAFYLLHFLQ